MLAYPVSKKPIDYNKPVFIQPKLDGVRCLIQYDNGVVTAYSRTGKVWKNIEHITLNLYKFFDKHPNVVLDGELYNHDFRDDFEQIISMVRKTKPDTEARAKSRDNVQFHCYDFVNKKMKFSTRNLWLTKNLPTSYCVERVQTLTNVGNYTQAKIFHTNYLYQGYEGSIIRTNDPYQCKRSHNLRKFKDFSDAEARIVGYELGKGKREGTLGKFLMEDEDGNKFGCPPGKGYNYKDMTNMLKNIHDYIGQIATFTYFGRTKANSYRHPLFKCIRNYE